MKNILSKLGIEVNFFNLTKGTHKNTFSTHHIIIFNEETLKMFPGITNDTKIAVITSIQDCIGSPSQ